MDAPRKAPKHKANFFDAAKEQDNKPSRRKRLAMEEAEAEERIKAGGSLARPNPRAEGKAREAAKQLNTMAKKAARSGARNAAANAFAAAKTLINAAGGRCDADAMALAKRGRDKAKDVKLRALAALKARPATHKMLSPSGAAKGGAGAKTFQLFRTVAHSNDETGFSLFVTSKPIISLKEVDGHEDAEEELQTLEEEEEDADEEDAEEEDEDSDEEEDEDSDEEDAEDEDLEE